jgi:hypothetical protein
MAAGYSGTPLVKKLGYAAGQRVLLSNPPPHYADLLGPLPDSIEFATRAAGPLDLIHAFFVKQADLAKRFPALAKSLAPAGMVWVSWPKRTSRVATDLTEDVVRRIGLAGGLVDVKVCAVDDVWSALKFLRRLKDR